MDINIINLPIIVLDNIFFFITDTETYNNVRLTCKSFYHLLKLLKKFDNNTLVEIFSIIDKKKHGFHIKWNHSTELKMICQYHNDKLTNNYLEFFDNGFVKKKVIYNDGMKMGIEKKYYNNGFIKSMTNYCNNKIIGTRCIYNKKGMLQFTIEYHKVYDLIFVTKYSKNKIVMQGHFYKNKLHGLVKYYKNNYRYSYDYFLGNLRSITNYKNDNLKEKINLKNGVKEGYHYIWSDDNILNKVYHYKNNCLDGVTKIWNNKTCYSEQISYKKNLLHGNYVFDSRYKYRIIPHKNGFIDGIYKETLKLCNIQYDIKFENNRFSGIYNKYYCKRIDTRIIIYNNHFKIYKYRINKSIQYIVKKLDNTIHYEYYNLCNKLIYQYNYQL